MQLIPIMRLEVWSDNTMITLKMFKCVTEKAEVDSSHDTFIHDTSALDTSVHETSGLIPLLMKHHGTSMKLFKLNLGCPTQFYFCK